MNAQTDFDEHLPIFQRRLIPHPTIELPLSPPATPTGDSTKSFSAMTSATSMNSELGQTASQRHTYAGVSTPDISGSPNSASPLSLPALLSSNEDEENFSPGSSVGVVTPPLGSSFDRASAVGDRYAPAPGPSQSQQQSGGQFEKNASAGYPAVPAHFQQPLRVKVPTAFGSGSTISLDNSPPSTPKGHPAAHFRSQSSFFPLSSTPANARPKPSSAMVQTPTYRALLSRYTRIPRRHRPMVLFGFCVLTFFVILLSPSKGASSLNSAAALNRQLVAGKRYVQAQGASAVAYAKDQMPSGASSSVSSTVEPLQFANEAEEFAALVAYITSSTSNSLPPLDPSQPLDPGSILEFDPTRPSASEDLALLQDEVNTLYPLVVVGKMRDPWHREIKKMLAEYRITPSPLIIDVDQRKDHLLFEPLLARLIGTTDLPQVIVQGKSLGSYHDVLNLREKGALARALEDSGAISVRIAKKKKKGVKEAQRLADEQVLAPKPIAVS